MDIVSTFSMLHGLPMQFSINYASRRSEVWRWYLKAWRHSFWRFHLLVFFCVASSASQLIYRGMPTGIIHVSIVAIISVLPLIGMALFPMWKFKPQVRTLRVDEMGIDTEIGKQSKSIPWNEVANVGEDGDNLVIQLRNQNAFIVPARAFSNVEAQSEFRDFVLKMVRGNGS